MRLVSVRVRQQEHVQGTIAALLAKDRVLLRDTASDGSSGQRRWRRRGEALAGPDDRAKARRQLARRL
jgi:hypothetical protein